jgi:hypothetical protein
VVATDNVAPYELDYLLDTQGTVFVEAKAYDPAGNEGSAQAVSILVTEDPGTTATGTVVDKDGLNLVGANVTCSSIDGVTDDVGEFSIEGIPTIEPQLSCSASYFDVDAGLTRNGVSATVDIVRGGTTDVGIIRIVPDVSYIADFTNGVTAIEQCAAWKSFRSDMVGLSFSEIILRGSNDIVGVSCAGEAANQLCQAIANTSGSGSNSTNLSLVCNGRTWNVGNCGVGNRESVEISANGNICQCSSGYVARPCIGNSNWGGIGSNTCFAPSQTIEVICR